MIAIISDIHGNLAALEAVLAECERLGVEEYLCLGDVIGYGPDPAAVTRIARERFRVTLMGNHEHALFTANHGFNPYAAEAIQWTRHQLEEAARADGIDYLAWYGSLSPFVLEGRRLMVHGSIYDPVHDYVDAPENPVEAETMIHTLERDFTGFDVCFAGHNHTPFLATRVGTMIPHEAHNRFRVPAGHKAYICVGSVGQPRDLDWRASFATLEGDTVTYHRLEYDIGATQRKIHEAGLHPFLADRLQRGI